MKKRLFVFGDSWANNYFSKINSLIKCKPFLGLDGVESFVKYHNYFGHWIDHISHYYDVYSYGVGAATNEQIIFQLGNLPDYEEGDRIVMIFTTPQRFNWIDDKKKYSFVPNGTQAKKLFGWNDEIIKFIESQYIERNDWWFDDSVKKDEINFINNIPNIYKNWNPIMITWTSDLSDKVKSVDLINFNEKFTNITEETDNNIIDSHLGLFGNFELFKYISKKLNIDVSSYQYAPKKYIKSLL